VLPIDKGYIEKKIPRSFFCAFGCSPLFDQLFLGGAGLQLAQLTQSGLQLLSAAIHLLL